MVDEIILNITKSKELELFLQNEEEGLIKWSDSMIREFLKINKIPICGLDTSYSLAENLFKSTKDIMIVPARTPDIARYDEEVIDSLETFNKKEGTSSEFSAVYASFLRIFGIPSRIVLNNMSSGPYYFVETYIEDEGWIIADIYNENAKFGECINLSEDILEKDIQFSGVCLPSLYPYVKFQDIKIWKYGNRWFKMDGTLKSKINRSLDYYSLSINVTFYGSDMEEIFSDWTYLLTNDTLGNETTHAFSINLFSEEPTDFKCARIDIGEFYSR